MAEAPTNDAGDADPGFPHGEAVEALIAAALAEDHAREDVTVAALPAEDRTVVAELRVKAPGVLCGLPIVARVFAQLDAEVAVEAFAEDGDTVGAGLVALQLEGPARAILRAERTILNLLQRLSGIATLTAAYVEAAMATHAGVYDTRKTTPGWRLLEKAAVRAGGGTNHRTGLHDMVLIKENHVEAAGGLEAAVRRVRMANEAGLPVEVEVRTLDELERTMELGVERILLDNMDLATMERAVARAAERGAGRPRLEASGNVTLETVRAVAETGVDLVSVGALTHSAPTADLSLRVEG